MLCIVVVLYQNAEELPLLLDCLARQTWRDWKLVLIDNSAAAHPNREWDIRSDDRVIYQANMTNEGFARAVNRGLRLAGQLGAERCMLLNPDVSFGPDFLLSLNQRWDTLGADVIAPRIMRQEQPDCAWYAGGRLDFGWIFSNSHEPHDPAAPDPRVVEFASGCCLGLTLALLRRIGLLDESFFVYWEDTDFCLRLRAAAVPIHYVAEPMLLHAGAASSGGERSPGFTRLYYRSYAILLRKHFGWKHAMLTALRVIMKERERGGRAPGHAGRVALALVTGLGTRLRPEPRL